MSHVRPVAGAYEPRPPLDPHNKATSSRLVWPRQMDNTSTRSALLRPGMLPLVRHTPQVT